jgi:hypothetical protein
LPPVTRRTSGTGWELADPLFSLPPVINVLCLTISTLGKHTPPPPPPPPLLASRVKINIRTQIKKADL